MWGGRGQSFHFYSECPVIKVERLVVPQFINEGGGITLQAHPQIFPTKYNFGTYGSKLSLPEEGI